MLSTRQFFSRPCLSRRDCPLVQGVRARLAALLAADPSPDTVARVEELQESLLYGAPSPHVRQTPPPPCTPLHPVLRYHSAAPLTSHTMGVGATIRVAISDSSALLPMAGGGHNDPAGRLPSREERQGWAAVYVAAEHISLPSSIALLEIVSLYATSVTARCAFTALPCTNTLHPCLFIAHSCVRAFV
jgi:hypothetical protein